VRWLVAVAAVSIAAVAFLTVGCDEQSWTTSGTFTSFRDLPNGDQEVCILAGGKTTCYTGFISITQGPLEGRCVVVSGAGESGFLRVVRSDDACEDGTTP
jgi:hypothetical protein